MQKRNLNGMPQPGHLSRGAAVLLCGGTAVLALLMILLLVGVPNMIRAEEGRAATGDGLVPSQQIEKSVQDALTSNRAEFEDLKIKLQQIEDLQATVKTAIKAFESQNATHGQLLLSAQLRLGDLEKALTENRLSRRTLGDHIVKFQKSHDAVANIVQQSDDRIDLARQQLDNIRESQFSDDQKRKIEAATAELLKLLEAKNKLGTRYLKISSDLLARMNAADDEKNALEIKLKDRLASMQKASFLSRTDASRYFSWTAVREAFRFFGTRVAGFFDPTTWKDQWVKVRLSGAGQWAFFLAALATAIVLQGRCRAYLRRIEEKCEGPGWYYRCLGMLLLRRSLLYLWMTILFGLYVAFDLALLDIGFKRFLYYLFLILLMTRWGLDYLAFGYKGSPTALRQLVSRHLNRFILLFRTLALVVITIFWLGGVDSLLSWIAWDVMVVALLVRIAFFWRQLKPVAAAAAGGGQPAPDPKKIALIRGGSYLALGGALFLSLLGYGSLSGYWLGGWIKTLVLVFLGWLGLNPLHEWQDDHRSETEAAHHDQIVVGASPLRWSIIQLIRFCYFIGLAAGVIWSWDRAGYLVDKIGAFIGWTFAIGNLNLSIKGILMAGFIIYLTYLGVRIGRAFLNNQILANKELERGFKDSVLTVTSYLAWGLGLMLALAVIGVDATSLAVVFGALSVGIGFGLQTIFNNFISGLILLFERPIQVGDYVEVGGLWAEVKQINVRATVVQTFDNASVIIPNSEFISQQVTNWSFKDRRMRRNIEVGVAYGSDIDLVEQTLLEIVQDRKRVLKYPRPDVLFIDHAASALIFRLRIWVQVDDYWDIPSRIRFDIDKRFRELGIEIAFPQQDIHIRSYPEAFKPRTPATVIAESPEPPSE